jgi:hypothetical protein
MGRESFHGRFSCVKSRPVRPGRDGTGTVLHKKQASCAQPFTQQPNVEEATHPAGAVGEQTPARTSQAKQ